MSSTSVENAQEEISRLRAESQEEISRLRAEAQEEISRLRAEIRDLRTAQERPAAREGQWVQASERARSIDSSDQASPSTGLYLGPPQPPPSAGANLGPKVHPDGSDEFSDVRIDKNGLMRLNEEEIEMVQKIYKAVQCDNKKFPYMTGDPKFAMRNLNFKEPDQNVENVIVGKCQSGKSGEAAWVAWCTWFVLGCLPVILVRNSGGKSGTDDMIQAIKKLNEMICGHLNALGVDEQEHDKYLLTNRLTEEDQIPLRQKGFGYTGSVLIVLNNVTHLRRLGSKIARRNAESGLSVAERLDQYSRKDGRARMVLIIDEADLVVGSPGRRGNASERMHFEEQLAAWRVGSEMARGLRELVFGSVSITATPIALFLSSIKTIMCPICEKFFGPNDSCVGVKHLIRVESDDADGSDAQPRKRTEKAICHFAHEHCIGPLVDHCEKTGEELLCRSCCGQDSRDGARRAVAGALPDETESDEDEDEDSSSSHSGEDSSNERALTGRVVVDPADLEWDAEHGASRVLKPHVVNADVPGNYVAYTTAKAEADGPWKIQREITPERVAKITKTQAYKQYFTRPGGANNLFDEDDWDDMVKKCKTGGPQEIIPGFSLTCSTDGRVSVYAKRKRDADMQKVFSEVEEMYRGLQTSQSTHNLPSAIKKDGDGIEDMVVSMMTSNDAFRNGLIISDNTKNTSEQDKLLWYLRERYNEFFDKGLALVKWDCKSIKIAFTVTAATLNPSIMTDVRNMLEQLGASVKVTDGVDAAAGRECVVIERQPRISVVLEALKNLSSRVLIVTGEIGGRGVPYHSLCNQRILTDMFTGQSVPETTEVTAHGEYLIQLLGRLNTIHCLFDDAPVIRLWASESVHQLHMLHLTQVDKAVELVQRYKSYEEAYKHMILYTAGRKPNGKTNNVHASRCRFRAQQQAMSQGGTALAELGQKRSRDIALGPTFLHRSSTCYVEPHYPITYQARVGEDDQHNWTPDQGEWDEELHIKWSLGVTPEHVEQSAGKFADLSSRDAGAAGIGFKFEGMVTCEPADQQGHYNLAFKSLVAAQGFIEQGGAGAKEARLMQLHLRDEQAAADQEGAENDDAMQPEDEESGNLRPGTRGSLRRQNLFHQEGSSSRSSSSGV